MQINRKVYILMEEKRFIFKLAEANFIFWRNKQKKEIIQNIFSHLNFGTFELHYQHNFMFPSIFIRDSLW